MIKALLFDYGGTLDTCGRHWSKVLREAWLMASLCPPDELAFDAYVYAERKLSEPDAVAAGDTFREVLRKKLCHHLTYLHAHDFYLPAGTDFRVQADEIAAALDAAVRDNLLEVRPMLRRLKARFRLVLVSNFYGNLQAVLKNYRLDDLFDAVVESAAVGVRKPDSAIWKLGVEQAHCLPSECVAIGDSMKNDIIPSAALGCQTIWLNPSPEKCESAPSAEATGPTFVARNYQDLESVFRAF